MADNYAIGLDIGSTTVKAVALDASGRQVYLRYQRHFADVIAVVKSMLGEIREQLGDVSASVAVTGSGGLSLAKAIQADFIQEVIAVSDAVRKKVGEADVVIELGGEDAKIIFLTGGAEQRMNGICAGGTGAFIDQMAALMQTDAAGLNELAKGSSQIYPIAARCGVFAKSDLQPLMNDGAAKEDLAASVFLAIVKQTISGLACGRRIKGKVVFLGGPLYFLSELRKAFKETLKLNDENAVMPEDAHLFAAYGAALLEGEREIYSLDELTRRLDGIDSLDTEMSRLPALFESREDYEAFKTRQSRYVVEKEDISGYEGRCYLGLDAGSTTMKTALVSEDGRLLWSWYGSNQGDPALTAKKALLEMYSHLGKGAHIARACSTGYGENLLKAAMHLDEGEVETISHYYAAQFFEPEVDCIVDIGGQDMKCISIRDGCVDNIILNEACSSGCGSFLENFANSLGCTADDFADRAVQGRTPMDLGTRCTVFMNSNVKQAQKEGASVEDIAAGLSYSVVKNALFKVMKVKDASTLGKKIVVQGGTFYNDAVLRCFELVSGREVIRPDIAGLMGAFGAALIAREHDNGRPSTILSEEEVRDFTYTMKTAHCQGCINHCRLTVNRFADGETCISGNRCEKGLEKKRNQVNPAPNLFEYKRKRLFDYEDYAPLAEEEAPRGIIGIPRVLNQFEDFPFWAVFFKKLGFKVVLSPFSDGYIYSLGMESIPSESECYPAKLAHGHVEWLIEHGVKTIFYPCVSFERRESKALQFQFNCPMVISYSENIKNNMETLGERNIRFLNPFLSFKDEKILRKCLRDFMREAFDINEAETDEAARAGWRSLLKFREDVACEGERTLQWMEEHHAKGVVLAGRPYHLDPGINHGIPEMVHSYGLAVLTEDSVSELADRKLVLRATNQWMYHARLYAAAEYVAGRKDLEMIQLNSFGCGLDAITTDQVQDMLHQAGKMYTLLKIDEVSNLGAARIRVRSMLAAMRMRDERDDGAACQLKDYDAPKFTKKMHRQKYTILCTDMIPYHFELFEAAMQSCGYNLEIMRSESRDVVDLGLKYVNNDACYPALITTGQVMEAVLSGRYDTDHLAVIMSQPGGGCRANNYVGFLRKALNEAGYSHIPVISMNLNYIDFTSGFIYSVKMGVKALQAILYGDILMQALHRVRPYEETPGSANALYDKWMDYCRSFLLRSGWHFPKFYRSCKTILKEFDALPLKDCPAKPRVGIVGELLVKYMPLANNHLDELLEEEGAEVMIPDFVDFIKYLFHKGTWQQKNLNGPFWPAVVGTLANMVVDLFRKPIYRAMKKSERFQELPDFKEMKTDAGKVLSLGNQCGEGWLLAGEITDLIRQGAHNIVCAQPFGCLPNHVVGKGIVKKLKAMYPQSNIVAIDYDPSASRVNQLNRIKLMMEVALRED
ncbi:MAG: acyl-CoA dehydratase activase-related protein [Clostridiales bacterium]|nr:acyl-CoA dehydratase activase-related protein [Clostridiales bacterium]